MNEPSSNPLQLDVADTRDSAGCALTHGSAEARQRGDLYWIIQALRPNIEIRIKTDWEPKYRLWRYLRKGNCEICGRRFREMEEGTISKREKLCGAHCMMTTDEIAAHNSLNVERTHGARKEGQ